MAYVPSLEDRVNEEEDKDWNNSDYWPEIG